MGHTTDRLYGIVKAGSIGTKPILRLECKAALLGGHAHWNLYSDFFIGRLRVAIPIYIGIPILIGQGILGIIQWIANDKFGRSPIAYF